MQTIKRPSENRVSDGLDMKRLTVSLAVDGFFLAEHFRVLAEGAAWAAVAISIRHKKEAIFCIMEENLSNTKQRYRVKSSFTLRLLLCFDKAMEAV